MAGSMVCTSGCRIDNGLRINTKSRLEEQVFGRVAIMFVSQMSGFKSGGETHNGLLAGLVQ